MIAVIKNAIKSVIVSVGSSTAEPIQYWGFGVTGTQKDGYNTNFGNGSFPVSE